MRLHRMVAVVLGLSTAAGASADVILLKDGGALEGTLVDGKDPSMAVVTITDMAQARAAEKRRGWRVVMRGGAAEITLPRSAIEDVVDPAQDATPLIQALEHPDKRLRYAAAIALAGMRPSRPFVGADKVVRNLADAVGEAGIRVVLVVTDDVDLSNRLAARVRQAQYIPVQALSAYECLAALKRSPGKDLILLDASLGRGAEDPAAAASRKADQDLIRRVDEITHYQAGDKDLPVEKRYARELFLNLQDDYRARHVPVIVVADDADLDQVQKIYEGRRVAGFLSKTAEESRVKGSLMAVFQREDPALRDSKDLADDVSRRASRALAGLSRNDPVFAVGDAETALIRTFSEGSEPRRADGVREAALDAAAAIGTEACHGEAVRVVSNGGNPPSLRQAAARAIGAIAKASGAPLPAAVVAGLKEALKDPEPAVWMEAARALGLSQLDLAGIRGVWAQERLEKPLKE